MTLLDHFRPPLSLRRHWHAFHNAWATYLASDLNALLPEGYFAEPNVQFAIEIDVAAFEEPLAAESGGTGAMTWAPPAASMTIPLALADETAEVLLFQNQEGPTLAGAIELVSPANKDRPGARQAFVSKCETYLHAGAGLVIVDVVTDRRASLHDELLTRLGALPPANASVLYTSAYRAIRHQIAPRLDIWHERLALGAPLPTMPLWLRGNLCLPVDLAASYERTCLEHRVR